VLSRLPPSEEGEWWELADDSRGGLPYYYHTKTGETVWERPEAFVIPLGILQVTSYHILRDSCLYAVQNTSLARRLSARFSIGAQLDGDFPTNDKVEHTTSSHSRTTDNGDANTSAYLDNKRKSQSSTRSSPARIIPSASSLGFSASKNQAIVPRRSFSSDQYHTVSKRGPHLPTIPGSDVSDGPIPASPLRKSPSSLNTKSNKKDSPPKTNGTSSTSSPNSSISRARSKAYSTHRSPQPQSLNAAVELLSTPVEATFPSSPLSPAPIRSSLSGMYTPLLRRNLA
jgi:Rho GTPase-activating protein 39